MKIVKLKGGLGNQMFQYAFAKYLQVNTNDTVGIDLSGYVNDSDDLIRKPRIKKFDISLPTVSTDELRSVCKFDHSNFNSTYKYKAKIILEILLNKNYFFEQKMMPENLDKIKKYTYFDGYWQSWKYINEIYGDIKKDFLPKYPVSESTRQAIEEVKTVQSVFVGIRRGDYLKFKKLYGEFSINYYLSAMELLESHVKSPVYYIFSNDIDWVKQNMDFGNREIVYRENENVIDDFEELIMMSNCRHSIIQNSTYHWWGARLNYYDGKIVIAPKNWFYDGTKIDIIPPGWIKI